MHRQVLSCFALCGAVFISAPSESAPADEESSANDSRTAVEEVIVTAQRVAESIQDVPIAVTALTDEALRDRQVITPSDLQLNAPNVSFGATNFGSSTLSIRGIGRLVVGRSGESGVSSHMNEIAVPSNLETMEFFDVERVEILRGPQGTLFGRNATGGAINLVTKMPSTDGFDGFADVEAGSFNHSRLKGAINLPVGGRIAARVAAFRLERDGYTENLAYGQEDSAGNTLPGIDEDVDGRGILALRATLSWDLTDRATAWFQYHRTTEDDDRARITNQVCARNPLPTTGCLANAVGRDTPHLSATTAGIFAGLGGMLPLGADGSQSALYDFPRPTMRSFREMHTDFEPVFWQKEEVWAFGVDYDFDNLRASLIGGRRNNDFIAQQDYFMNVGARLASTPLNPRGIWPVSEPAGGAGEEWRSERCNLVAGTAGAIGGCILPAQQNRSFGYDQQDSHSEYYTLEAKIHSEFDGPLGFLLGASRHDDQNYGGYYVLSNELDAVTSFGAPALELPPLFPGFFYNANNPESGAEQDGWATFGEIYYDVSDRLKLTLGLRFNEDNKSASDTSVLFNSLNASAALGGVLGPNPIWLRSGLFGEMVGMASNPAASLSDASRRLLEFWNAQGVYEANAPTAIASVVALGAAQAIGAQVAAGLLPIQFVPQAIAGLPLPPIFQATVGALLSQNPAVIAQDAGLAAAAQAFGAIANALTPVPGFGETRFVTGSPSEAQWRELSGRAGFDYQIDDNTMVYGFLSRGYKPGGFNPAIPPAFQDTSAFTFDSEQVTAIEAGVKSTLLDGGLVLNGSVFSYDYTGLQVTRIKNNSSINENIDSGILGLELEGRWLPQGMPGVAIDFAYGSLFTDIKGSQSVDPINRTGGNSDYILLNNIDPGSLTGVNYIARESQITAALVAAALQVPAALDIRNGLTVESVSYPANAAGVSIPAFFSRNFLVAAGVETLDGLPVNLDGNELPNAPRHTIKLGLSHSWNVGSSALVTLRWDYYWQSESYAREFNTVGDKIDSWSQHNLSLIYESGGNWSARAWVRNVQNKEIVTGKYLTTDTSGFFRNYFLTEPRIYGVSVRFAPGG